MLIEGPSPAKITKRVLLLYVYSHASGSKTNAIGDLGIIVLRLWHACCSQSYGCSCWEESVRRYVGMRNAKKFGWLLAVCLLPMMLCAEDSVNLTWVAPTENVDGSPLTDLAGFSVHYGTAAGVYDASVDVGNVTEVTLDGFTEGETYYLTATAYDAATNHSEYAAELVWKANDLTAPEIITPEPINLVADAFGRAEVPDVTLLVSVTDNVSSEGEIVLTQIPAAGSEIGIGTTSVTVMARDLAGNEAQATVSVVVTRKAPPMAPANLRIVL